MKRIGLLVLAIVLVMGTLGVSYAMWSDSVTMYATVNAGNVDLNVVRYSNTWVWKTPGQGANEMLLRHTWDDVVAESQCSPYANCVPPIPSPYTGFMVAFADADYAGDDAVNITIYNAFPLTPADDPAGVGFECDMVLRYDGTVPIIATAVLDSLTGDGELLAQIAVVKYYWAYPTASRNTAWAR